jgi:hypothetical protein
MANYFVIIIARPVDNETRGNPIVDRIGEVLWPRTNLNAVYPGDVINND